MKHTRKKSNGMRRHMLLLPVLLVAVVALILGASAPGVWAQDDPVCFFNIELNASDLDVGVRGFFDWEPWKELEIEDPDDETIVKDKTKGSMKEQGKAEFFFESGEPMLTEVPFSEFLGRFPVGYYEFEAEAIEGDDEGECEELFTHVIPCAPEISAAGNRGLGVTISWDPVTQVVDTEETDDEVVENGEDAEVVCMGVFPNLIVGYEVIVETEVDGEVKIYEIDLPADATSVSVPPEFIALGDEFQFEVLAIEESGNQTITEEDFCVNERNGRVEECE